MNVQTRIPILDLGPQVAALLPQLQDAIQHVLLSTHYIMGPEEKAFELEVARFLGVKHAVGLNSGTDALVIALRALGIGPGDEVITTPFTFFATAEAISNVGATPVFVDVDPATMNLDANLIEAACTPKTRALLPVHLFGRPCDMAAILAIADRHGLKVVEDCAQSFGARFNPGPDLAKGRPKSAAQELSGKCAGSMGDIGCFSFFPSKNLGAVGDGGLLATNDDKLAESARMLRAHGSKTKYHNETVGYNSRLDELQAAILRVKFPHVEEWNQARRRVASAYQRLLGQHPAITTPEVAPGHVFHQYTIQVRGHRRNQLQAALSEAGIDTMIYYPVPCHKLKIYQESHAQVVCPHAERLADEVISLPIWPEMPDEIVALVADAVLASVGRS